MKRISQFLICSMLPALVAVSAEGAVRRSQGYATGIGGYSGATGDGEISGGLKGTWDTSISGAAFGFRLGSMSKGFRIAAGYEGALYEEIFLHTGLGFADMTFQVARRFYAFAGGHIGWAYGKWSGSGDISDGKVKGLEKTMEDETATGWVIGGQAGAYYRVARKFDIEFGGRLSYMGINTEKKTSAVKIEQDLTIQYVIYGGLTYRF